MDKDRDVCEWCGGTGFCFGENRSSYREVCRCVSPPIQAWPSDSDAEEADRLHLEEIAQDREEEIPAWVYAAGMEVV